MKGEPIICTECKSTLFYVRTYHDEVHGEYLSYSAACRSCGAEIVGYHLAYLLRDAGGDDGDVKYSQDLARAMKDIGASPARAEVDGYAVDEPVNLKCGPCGHGTFERLELEHVEFAYDSENREFDRDWERTGGGPSLLLLLRCGSCGRASRDHGRIREVAAAAGDTVYDPAVTDAILGRFGEPHWVVDAMFGPLPDDPEDRDLEERIRYYCDRYVPRFDGGDDTVGAILEQVAEISGIPTGVVDISSETVGDGGDDTHLRVEATCNIVVDEFVFLVTLASMHGHDVEEDRAGELSRFALAVRKKLDALRRLVEGRGRLSRA